MKKKQYLPRQLFIEIKDNGKGFDAQTVTARNKEKSMGGILSMYKRARILEAEFKIESSLGKGTNISLIVPIINTDHGERQIN